MRSGIVRIVSWAMEGLVTFLAIGSVWPFASIHLFFLWALYGGVALLLVGWAIQTIIEGRILWKACPVIYCLAGMCLLTILQIIPLPVSWITFLSPSTTELRENLNVSARESGLGEQLPETATLSLDPGATRFELLRLIAVLSLFAIVRNNFENPGAFYRLSWLVVANGVMLALIGMAQMASSPPNVSYWSVVRPGQVFGPFGCRNHAAFYLNLCLGLATGLLLGTRFFLAADRSNWRGFFRDPRILWLVCGIAAMLAGLLATLSRGGLIGFILAAGACFALFFFRSRKSVPWVGIGFIAILAVLLTSWQGSDRIGMRWEKTLAEDAPLDSRVDIWRRSLPLIRKFPVWVWGLGTFVYLEPMSRRAGEDYNYLAEHAHNDFLELWIEGGVLQFALAIIIVIIVFQRSYRAFCGHGDTGLGRLAFGAMIGFTAIVIHSFVDFGLHIPAVAVLTAVVGAMLMNLAEVPKRGMRETPVPAGLASFPGAVLQAFSLVAIALFLVVSGWRDQLAERYHFARQYVPLPDRLQYAKAAVALAPDRVIYQAELSDCYLGRALSRRHHLETARTVAFVGASGTVGFPQILGNSPEVDDLETIKDLRTAEAILQVGCRKSSVVEAVHKRLELISSLGVASEFHKARIDRLLLLYPNEPRYLFKAGKFALNHGDKAAAFPYFRDCLAATSQSLPDMIPFIPSQMSASEFLENVLAGNTKWIHEAAGLLREEMSGDQMAAFYEAGLRDLAKRDKTLTAEDWMLKARFHAELHQDDRARAAYQAALNASPFRGDWRLEYGQFLIDVQDYKLAKAELRREAQSNGRAEELYRFAVAMESKIAAQPQKPRQVVPKDSRDDLVRKATVRVFNKTTNSVAHGVVIFQSGFVFDALTAAHAIGAGHDIEVQIFVPDESKPRGSKAEIVKLGRRDVEDLAQLRFRADPEWLTPLPVAPLEIVRTPFEAFSAASEAANLVPTSRDEKVLSRAVKNKASFWRTEKMPDFGRSGGPLVDIYGRVIGICSGNDGRAGYYTSIDEIRRFVTGVVLD